jgi:CheY-like chemotaxis protein
MASISSSLTSSRTAGGGGELLARSSFAGVNDERLILVVEDDDATRSFLLDNLAADGFRVAGASSPQEGVRAIEVRQPSLVVLDLAFDTGSGLDLLDRLRTADGLASRLDPDLPVIVLTGRAGEADRVRSFARGADDHLSKPTCRFPQRVISVRASGSVIWSSMLHSKCARCVRQEDTACARVSALGCRARGHSVSSG